MKRLFLVLAALSLAFPVMVGCDKKAEVKKVETTTTPGGSTTVTDTQKVETSGENPPPAK